MQPLPHRLQQRVVTRDELVQLVGKLVQPICLAARVLAVRAVVVPECGRDAVPPGLLGPLTDEGFDHLPRQRIGRAQRRRLMRVRLRRALGRGIRLQRRRIQRRRPRRKVVAIRQQREDIHIGVVELLHPRGVLRLVRLGARHQALLLRRRQLPKDIGQRLERRRSRQVRGIEVRAEDGGLFGDRVIRMPLRGANGKVRIAPVGCSLGRGPMLRLARRKQQRPRTRPIHHRPARVGHRVAVLLGGFGRGQLPILRQRQNDGPGRGLRRALVGLDRRLIQLQLLRQNLRGTLHCRVAIGRNKDRLRAGRGRVGEEVERADEAGPYAGHSGQQKKVAARGVQIGGIPGRRVDS